MVLAQNVRKDKQIADQAQKLEVQERTLETLKGEMAELKRQMAAGGGGGGGGGDNIVVNGNVNIDARRYVAPRAFGQENMDALDHDFVRETLSTSTSARELETRTATQLWANPDFPENATVTAVNVKDPQRVEVSRGDDRRVLEATGKIAALMRRKVTNFLHARQLKYGGEVFRRCGDIVEQISQEEQNGVGRETWYFTVAVAARPIAQKRDSDNRLALADLQ